MDAHMESMSLMGDSERVCRNCHDSEPTEELIAPCNCNGSIKWVHRSCLDEWRAVSPNPTSFAHCDVCQFEYQLIYEGEGGCDWQKIKFSFLVTRDFLLLFLIINTITSLCSLFIWAVDKDYVQRDQLCKYLHLGSPPHLLINWVSGWAFFFFCLGIMAIFYSLLKCCGCLDCGKESRGYTHDTYNYNGFGVYYCWFCWYPGPTYNSGSCGSCGLCGCGNCTGSSGNSTNCSGGDCKVDDAGGLVALLVVIVILIIIIGAIVGILLVVLFGMAVAKRHVYVLNQRAKAGRYVVADLSTGYAPENIVPDFEV
eukprot:TRINITY_DN2187_c0_g1_i1.p1 TRINITY_DN2187_c0_g1~~TRINITY_DN2187_c0_g1_i1.p1  ORF type:complete len:311 (-),score=36.70 TRINITY_DN2187_c0_g1_i1:23-955(-)